jgi:hypothetical protein
MKVDPDIAEKVLGADLRNHVKKVGGGATLSGSDRQMFIAFAAGGEGADLHGVRKSHLLRKWLFGGKLTKEEQDEISEVVPDVPRRVTRENYERPPEGYGHLAINRRTFFRWKSVGESTPGGQDLPPFDHPEQLEAWYERMRSAGQFKNRLPKAVRRAVQEFLSSRPTTSTTQVRPEEDEKPGVSDAVKKRDPGAARGLMVEIEEQEHHVASLRVARDTAYQGNDRNEGDRLDRQYREALDQLSVVKQRTLKTLEQEGRLVDIDIVERELAPRLQTVVQGGLMFYDRIASKLEALPDHGARRKLWREEWIKHCKSLVEGRFAPPLQLEALV